MTSVSTLSRIDIMESAAKLLALSLLCLLVPSLLDASLHDSNVLRFAKGGHSHGKAPPIPSVNCSAQPQANYSFCNASLSPEERATDLVGRLTLDEAIQQTSSIAPNISRLGINAYNWRSNCLHGWSKSGGHWTSNLVWTVFPAPIGLGATFNASLVREVGRVTADEGRALHNVMLANFSGNSTEAAGLNCFSPNVNLFRDPRWGRGQETYGEDPYVISVIGTAYTQGLQEGDDPKYLKIAACAKHYAVHSGPERLRLQFQANVTIHDLYDTYLPAFKSQVMGANVSQMMPAYSGLRCLYQRDGAPDAANSYLLLAVLRRQFQAPNISVCSDNGAVVAVATLQKYVPSLEQAAAVCMKASTDLDLGHDDVYPQYLPKAVQDKLVDEADIRAAVWRSFLLRIRLGDFDPPSSVPYQSIDASHLNTPANQKLNLQAARESIVLLKNTDSTLPLQLSKIKKLAVVGPNANASSTLLSNYEGIPPSITTVLQGVKAAASANGVEVAYAPGCETVKCPNNSNFYPALTAVLDADYVIMVMGLDSTVEGEGLDRAGTECIGQSIDTLNLPGCQGMLVKIVMTYAPNVILVLINGGPVSLENIYDHKGVVGILEAFYPGPRGGTAVADVLFGKYNPSGRMPVTVYGSTNDLPEFVDYTMSTPPGRTYRYFTNIAQYDFGYGLSYTNFTYSNLVLSPSVVKPCDTLNVSVTVQNTGEVPGDEVILVYLYRKFGEPNYPFQQLVAFDKITLDPLDKIQANFTISPYGMSIVIDDGDRFVLPGDYSVKIGFNATLIETFPIRGTSTMVKDCPGAPSCLVC